MKHAQIQVKTTQKYSNHSDKDMFKTDATIGEKEGAIYVLYKQADGSDVNLKLKDGVITVKFTGATKANWLFENGKKTSSTSHTPQGQMIFEADTSNLEFECMEDHFSLKICYALYTHNKKLSENTFEILQVD
ncbi:MAG: hypothetical protein ATN33_04005 [Epulopiscium sp. Nele67-Bin001]|nr:MAG: hypothetical protein BEN18_10000 [Epulopiscium sp. Nuni2H_MBin001]OON94796.1 MAG: hypothetical protein ATN33_04005 [Epulopiscium sp. Nele67-Bin001]